MVGKAIVIARGEAMDAISSIMAPIIITVAFVEGVLAGSNNAWWCVSVAAHTPSAAHNIPTHDVSS